MPPPSLLGLRRIREQVCQVNGKWQFYKLHFNRYIYTPFDEG
jgi:hypothetical protein